MCFLFIQIVMLRSLLSLSFLSITLLSLLFQSLTALHFAISSTCLQSSVIFVSPLTLKFSESSSICETMVLTECYLSSSINTSTWSLAPGVAVLISHNLSLFASAGLDTTEKATTSKEEDYRKKKKKVSKAALPLWERQGWGLRGALLGLNQKLKN